MFAVYPTVHAKSVQPPVNIGDGSGSSLLLENRETPSTVSNTCSIFSSDGSSESEIKNRLYYRQEANGAIISLTNPNNVKVILKLSDLPTPVGNVITLDSNTIYQISGTIDLGTNTITSTGNIFLRGTIPAFDTLITNSATALINYTNGNSIFMERLIMKNTGGPLFNIDTSNKGKIILDRIISSGGTKFGTFANSQNMKFTNISMNSLSDGITLTGTHNIIFFIDVGVPISASGSFTGLTIPSGVTINNFRYFDSIFTLALGQTGLNIDSSTVITNAPAHIDDIVFTGDGTALVGITPGEPNFEFFQNTGIIDSTMIAEVGFSESSPYIVPNSTSYVDISTSPATSIYEAFAFIERFELSDDTNGEITCISKKAAKGTITFRSSIAVSNGNQDAAVSIFADEGSGYVQCPNSEFFIRLRGNPVIFISSCYTLIKPGAKYKAQIKSLSNDKDFEVNTVAFSINT